MAGKSHDPTTRDRRPSDGQTGATADDVFEDSEVTAVIDAVWEDLSL